MLGRFLNKIFSIRCPICGNKPKGLSMTVQELIDALNKVKDKSKLVRHNNLSIVRKVSEGTMFVNIY